MHFRIIYPRGRREAHLFSSSYASLIKGYSQFLTHLKFLVCPCHSGERFLQVSQAVVVEKAKSRKQEIHSTAETACCQVIPVCRWWLQQ